MHAGTLQASGFALDIMEMLLKSCWAISWKEICDYEKPFPKGFSVFWKMLRALICEVYELESAWGWE